MAVPGDGDVLVRPLQRDDPLGAVRGPDRQRRALAVSRPDGPGADHQEPAVGREGDPVLVGVGGHRLDRSAPGARVDHREAFALERQQQLPVGRAYGRVVRLEPGAEPALGAVGGHLDAAGAQRSGRHDGDVEGVVPGDVDLGAVPRDVHVEGAPAHRYDGGDLAARRVEHLQDAGRAGDVDPDVHACAVRRERDAHAAAAVLAVGDRAGGGAVRDAGHAYAGAGVDDGDALGRGHPRAAVRADGQCVRGPAHGDGGDRAALGVHEGDGVGAEVRGEEQTLRGRRGGRKR